MVESLLEIILKDIQQLHEALWIMAFRSIRLSAVKVVKVILVPNKTVLYLSYSHGNGLPLPFPTKYYNLLSIYLI